MTSYDLEPFRKLTQVFDPTYRNRKDPTTGLGSFYVHETHEDYRQQMMAALQLNSKVKLLIAGQPGCGKTTLLRDVAREVREEGKLVVFIDLEIVTAVQDLGPAEMHMAAMAELLREADRRQITLPPETLVRYRVWLDGLAGEQTNDALTPTALADRLTTHLSAARDSAELRRELRELVRRGGEHDPAQVLHRLLGDLESHQPLLILDGLDKLPPEQAREFFLIEKKKPMAEAPAAAVLTIPLSVVYEPTFNVLSERYQNADNAVLPAVRLYKLDGERRCSVDEGGLHLLQKIVRKRIEAVDLALVRPEAVDRAIVGCGGNLRELARLIHASLVKTVVRRGTTVEQRDVEAAIIDQRESFRRAFQSRFLGALRMVRDQFRLENIDDVGKLLLYGLWVVEYRNGVTWYKLPVPVEQLLRDFDQPTGS